MNLPATNGIASKQKGFTLLEVLVAVLVLSVGILGMAGLQFAALRNNQQSYQRSQAAALVNELADLMRANRVAAGTGSYLLTLNTTLTGASNCATATCTEAQLAAHDLQNWQTRVLAALPAAKTRISCSIATCVRGSLQTITVMWDENRNGATGTGCTAAATDLACHSLSLTP